MSPTKEKHKVSGIAIAKALGINRNIIQRIKWGCEGKIGWFINFYLKDLGIFIIISLRINQKFMSQSERP